MHFMGETSGFDVLTDKDEWNVSLLVGLIISSL